MDFGLFSVVVMKSRKNASNFLRPSELSVPPRPQIKENKNMPCIHNDSLNVIENE
jgi:hypothetical protein